MGYEINPGWMEQVKRWVKTSIEARDKPTSGSPYISSSQLERERIMAADWKSDNEQHLSLSVRSLFSGLTTHHLIPAPRYPSLDISPFFSCSFSPSSFSQQPLPLNLSFPFFRSLKTTRTVHFKWQMWGLLQLLTSATMYIVLLESPPHLLSRAKKSECVCVFIPVVRLPLIQPLCENTL